MTINTYLNIAALLFALIHLIAAALAKEDTKEIKHVVWATFLVLAVNTDMGVFQ